MKKTKLLFAGIALMFMAIQLQGFSQSSDLYNEGSVWSLTFVKLKPNVADDYLKGLNKTWKASMDEMKKENLIKSYKILKGNAANREDFDLLLMMEFDNYSDFDPNPDRDAKVKAIEKRIRDKMGDEFDKTVANYTTLRDITGTKVMREIYLK